MRSTFTNQMIKAFIDPHGHNVLRVSDCEEEFSCTTFKEVTDILDSVDSDFDIEIVRLTDGHKLGWFNVTLYNDGIEQIIDHSDNRLMNSTYDRLERKYYPERNIKACRDMASDIFK